MHALIRKNLKSAINIFISACTYKTIGTKECKIEITDSKKQIFNGNSVSVVKKFSEWMMSLYQRNCLFDFIFCFHFFFKGFRGKKYSFAKKGGGGRCRRGSGGSRHIETSSNDETMASFFPTFSKWHLSASGKGRFDVELDYRITLHFVTPTQLPCILLHTVLT